MLNLLHRHYRRHLSSQLSAGSRRYQSTLRPASILKALDLDSSRVIPGVYFGSKWTGSGEILRSVNPADNSTIAEVQGVGSKRDTGKSSYTPKGTVQELQMALSEMEKAKKEWRLVGLHG